MSDLKNLVSTMKKGKEKGDFLNDRQFAKKREEKLEEKHLQGVQKRENAFDDVKGLKLKAVKGQSAQEQIKMSMVKFKLEEKSEKYEQFSKPFFDKKKRNKSWSGGTKEEKTSWKKLKV